MVPVFAPRFRLALARVRSRRARRWSLAVALVALLIVVLECGVCNMAHWRSLAVSTDSASYANVLGPGVHETRQGLLEVTDPAHAYVEVDADGSSPYIYVEPVSSAKLSGALAGPHASDVASTVYVRVQSGDGSAPSVSLTPYAPRSLYVKAAAHGASPHGALRVWIEEPVGAMVPIAHVRANVHVPFSWSWAQVGLMAAVALLVALLRPSSRWWAIPLNTTSLRQRLVFALVMTALGVAVLVQAAAIASTHTAPLTFHRAGEYTYDFDQYGHVADALLHGRTWLDLPVPDALAQAGDPYSVATRNALNSAGVSPLYWDYAFYHGHWYSYFGVVPAVLFFLPYQLVTSWFVPGGLMLPSACAELLAMFVFTLFACLLVVHLVKRCVPRTPLAGVCLLCVMFLIGANSVYLWYRLNFYSVPFATALMFTMAGLWLWLGADQAVMRRGRCALPGVPALSLPHLAGGACCIALTFGCRPTFALTALLAFALFWRQIRACGRVIASRDRAHYGAVARAVAAMILPAAFVVAPVCLYNAARFGSPFDFGNAYQLTVTDMTSFHTPLANIAPIMGYYFALPLRFQPQFPWLAISPTPLSQWAFTEPCVCGLFILAPAALAAFALPAVRRGTRRAHCTGMLASALVLGVLLAAFDSYVGGFAWRYMADFGWLFMLAAVPVLAYWMRVWKPARVLITLVAWWMVVLAVLSCFVVGRDDSLINNMPGLFHTVQAWFTLL